MVEPLENKQLAVFICYVADTPKGRQRRPIEKAPWSVRKCANDIAKRCEKAIDNKLKVGLRLLLGDLPSIAKWKEYGRQTLDQSTGKRIFTYNGQKILEVYPIEVEQKGGKIRVSQFVWCPLENGHKGKTIKEVGRV